MRRHLLAAIAVAALLPGCLERGPILQAEPRDAQCAAPCAEACCAPGEECRDDACVAVTADAALPEDGGLPDAGRADAGRADAGSGLKCLRAIPLTFASDFAHAVVDLREETDEVTG